MSDVAGHVARIARAENEIESIRTDLGGIKNQVTQLDGRMRGFGDILGRIEQSITSAQQQAVDDKQAARINPIALAAILISIISTLVGGSWLISGQLARQDARSQMQAQQIELIDARQWQARGGQIGSTEAHPQ